jgi:hypothetical protein
MPTCSHSYEMKSDAATPHAIEKPHALPGESVPAGKKTDPVDTEAGLDDRHGMAAVAEDSVRRPPFATDM